MAGFLQLLSHFVTATGVGDCLVFALQLEGLGWGKSKGSNHTYCRKCWIIIRYYKLFYDLTSRPHIRSDVGDWRNHPHIADFFRLVNYDNLCPLFVGGTAQSHSHIFDGLCMLLLPSDASPFGPQNYQPCWMTYPKIHHIYRKMSRRLNLIYCIYANYGHGWAMRVFITTWIGLWCYQTWLAGKCSN